MMNRTGQTWYDGNENVYAVVIESIKEPARLTRMLLKGEKTKWVHLVTREDESYYGVTYRYERQRWYEQDERWWDHEKSGMWRIG